MPAIPPGMRVLHAQELKIFFPIRTLLRQWRITKAGLNPGRDAEPVRSRFAHVINVLVAGDRTPAERAVIDRIEQRLRFAGLYLCFDQIPHDGK